VTAHSPGDFGLCHVNDDYFPFEVADSNFTFGDTGQSVDEARIKNLHFQLPRVDIEHSDGLII
jgi:hypothetical protein